MLWRKVRIPVICKELQIMIGITIRCIFEEFNSILSVKAIGNPADRCPCTHKSVCPKISAKIQTVKIVLFSPFIEASFPFFCILPLWFCLSALHPVKTKIPKMVVTVIVSKIRFHHVSHSCFLLFFDALLMFQ